MSKSSFELQLPKNYIDDVMYILNSIDELTTILIRTMNTDIRDPYVRKFFTTLENSVPKGSSIDLFIDELIHQSPTGDVNLIPFGSIWENIRYAQLKQQNSYAIKKLQMHGIEITFTKSNDWFGKIFTFMGRSHSKGIIIKNKSKQYAWIGGQNLDNFERIDFMLKTTNPFIISILYDIISQKLPTGYDTDYEVIVSPDITVFSDSGRRNSSIIYKKAVEIARSALSNFTYAGQLQPDSELLDAILLLGKRNVPVKIYLSTIESNFYNNFPYVILFKKFLSQVANFPSIQVIFCSAPLHAKLILADEHTQHRIGITGSHNFVSASNLFGTREVSVLLKGDEAYPLYLFSQKLYNTYVLNKASFYTI